MSEKSEKPDKKKDKQKAAVLKKKQALMLGLGLDGTDGHTRVTSGKNFKLVGGSQETHEVMQETAIKVNEELDRRHKRLEDIHVNEFQDILHKVRP